MGFFASEEETVTTAKQNEELLRKARPNGANSKDPKNRGFKPVGFAQKLKTQDFRLFNIFSYLCTLKKLKKWAL